MEAEESRKSIISDHVIDFNNATLSWASSPGGGGGGGGGESSSDQNGKAIKNGMVSKGGK